MWQRVMMGRYGRYEPGCASRPSDHRLCAESLERVDLGPCAIARFGELSSVSASVAFLARALAQGHAVMLLDEPFAGQSTSALRT